MKIKTHTNGHLLILLSIIGLYILYLLHFFGILQFKQHSSAPLSSSIFTGPYESCEDSVCGDCQTPECKKKCMCDRKQDILNCCEASCPNQACKDACVPMFDACA